MLKLMNSMQNSTKRLYLQLIACSSQVHQQTTTLQYQENVTFLHVAIKFPINFTINYDRGISNIGPLCYIAQYVQTSKNNSAWKRDFLKRVRPKLSSGQRPIGRCRGKMRPFGTFSGQVVRLYKHYYYFYSSDFVLVPILIQSRPIFQV